MARHLEKVMKKKNRLATMLVNLMKATMTFCLLSLALTILVKGQSNVPATNTRNNKDKTKRSSSPSLAQVNPTTLGLELALPLSEAAGRAGNSLPIALNYSSKVWRMETGDTATVYQGNFSHQVVLNVVPTFDEHSAAGWTSSLKAPYIESSDLIKYNYPSGGGGSNGGGCPYIGASGCGAPRGYYSCDATFQNASGHRITITCICENVGGGEIISISCPPLVEATNTTSQYSRSIISRKILHLPDGSTHELVATIQPVFVPANASLPTFNTYFSIDGSNIRLEMATDNSPQTLYLPDGSRYIFSFDANGYQTVQYTDRFGNKLSTVNNATLQRSYWRDTMGRTVAYPPLTKNYSNQNENGVGDFTYTVPGMNGGNLQYTFKWRRLSDADVLDTGETIKSVSQLFIHTTDNSQFNPVVLKEIVTPNGKSYLFKYNSFGEITRIEYPTGAVERFRYEALPPFSFSVGTPEVFYSQGNRGVVERWLNPDGNAANEQHWQYSIPRDNFLRATAPYRVITTAPDGTRSERYLYVGKEISNLDVPKLPSQLAGKAYEERVYAANGTLLRRVLTEWNAQNSTGGGNGGGCISICSESNGEGIVSENSSTINGSPSPYLSSYPRVTRTTNIIFELGSSQALAQSATYQYDGYTNVKREKGYDFTVLDTSTVQSVNISDIPLGNALRTTETDYKTDFAYTSRQMVSLLILTTVKQGDESGAIISKAEMFYDYDQSPYAPYTENSLPTQLASTWEDPGAGVKRGLLTTARTYYDFSNSNGYISTHSQYDQYGNIRKVWDASGDPNRFVETFYDDANNQTCGGQVCPQTYAYPTKVKTPAPDPNNTGHGSTEGSEVTTTYDFNTGLPLSVTNLNDLQNPNDDVTTTTEYNDSLLRPTRTYITPSGFAGETLIEYSDAVGNLFVKTKTQVDATNYAEATKYFDGLGREYKVKAKDLAGDIFIETQFDNMSRPFKTSNPYRAGQTLLWTETEFDSAGRVWKVKAPLEENQTQPAVSETTYGLLTSGNLIGTWVSAKDPAGKEMRSVTDSLGRLVRADEATTNGLGTPESPNQPTFYTYDLLGKLRKVTQGEQTRYFAFDSLGRLIRAKNVEQDANTQLPAYTDPITGNSQWSQAFTYDNNSNIVSQITARNITITNGYDALNRVVTRNYSDGTTPAVNYFYDGKGLSQVPDFSKGKLTKVTNTVSENRFVSFDVLGKVLTSQQITDGQTYETVYTYDNFGKLVSEKYPSGRVVTNSFDSLGRLASVSSKANQTATPRVYANGFGYNDKGVLNRMRLGNGLWEGVKFNNQFQTTELTLGTSASNGNRLKLEYDYGTTTNNGNVRSQTITVPTVGSSQGFIATQSYEYDELNRIKSAVETSNSQTNWQQHFRYDRYGNRTVITEQNRVGQEAFTTNSIVGLNPDINIANNRIVPKPNSSEQYQFDASGNMIRDAVGNVYSYDAENHQTQYFESTNTQTPKAKYFYDGDGRRVKKIVRVQSGQQTVDETTLFVYDGGGALVAEYTQNAPASTTPPQTVYLTADTLGSPRINTNQKGEVVARHDYLPFGDEIIGLGQRIQHSEYVDDNVRKKFTGYEKDEETGLDFAQARYYGEGLGRFTSVDPVLESIKPTLPQTWNRYAYVLNNPLNIIDPDGKNYFFVTRNGKHYWEWHGGKEVKETKDGQVWTDPETDTTYTSQWTHLIWVEDTGTLTPVDEGGYQSQKFIVKVYGENWREILGEETFSGMLGSKSSTPIDVGEYFADLSRVAEENQAKARGPQGKLGVAGLYAFNGFQFIPDKVLEKGQPNPQESWGEMRVYLSFAGWKDGQPVYVKDERSPYYIHDRGKARADWRATHDMDNKTTRVTNGCIGSPNRIVLNWMRDVIRARQQNIPTGVYPIIPVTVHRATPK
jgi:RHS repeat-associated protein